MDLLDIDKVGSNVQNIFKILFMCVNVFMSSRWFMETYSAKSHYFILGILGSLILGLLSKR